jgi:hypothetical protein
MGRPQWRLARARGTGRLRGRQHVSLRTSRAPLRGSTRLAPSRGMRWVPTDHCASLVQARRICGSMRPLRARSTTPYVGTIDIFRKGRHGPTKSRITRAFGSTATNSAG